MRFSKHTLSSQQASRSARAALRALNALSALSLCWVLALALVPLFEPAPDDVSVKAELRVGAHASTSVADALAAQGSLRALNARVRVGAAANQPLAQPAWLAALLLPLRLRAPSTALSVIESTRKTQRRAVARRWPLPRSSCRDADADPDGRV